MTPMAEAGEPTEYRQIQFRRPPGAAEVLLVRHGESAPSRSGEPFPMVEGQGDPALHADECVVVVSHGGTIGQILAAATSARPFAFTGADNGSISHLVVDGDRWIVRRYNDTAHLHPGFTTRPEPLT